MLSGGGKGADKVTEVKREGTKSQDGGLKFSRKSGILV